LLLFYSSRFRLTCTQHHASLEDKCHGQTALEMALAGGASSDHEFTVKLLVKAGAQVPVDAPAWVLQYKANPPPPPNLDDVFQ
jgi:hypothetical protein